MRPLRTDIAPETVEFRSKLEKQTVFFDITNRGEGEQIYKIKTTNSKDFSIKPVYFKINANKKSRVQVTYLGRAIKPSSKDRITVVYGIQLKPNLSVEEAWEDQKYLATVSSCEKRKYVKIAFKDEGKRPDDSGGAAPKSAMGSVMQKSATIRSQIPESAQNNPLNRDQDSYFALPTEGLTKIKPPPRKKTSARLEVEGEEGRDTKPASKASKKSEVSNEASQDEGETPPPPPPKPRSRRKVTAPPPEEEEEEEAPPPPPRPKKKPVPPRPVEATEDEEAPPAPPPTRTKTRKPQQTDEEEEEAPAPPPPRPKKKPTTPRSIEEEEAPPPPPPKAKPRSRRKTQSPLTPSRRPPAPMAANDADEATELDAKPISKIVPVTPPIKKTSRPSSQATPKQKTKRETPRKKDSGGSSFDPLQAMMSESKIVYVIQQTGGDDDEDSDRKARKKSSKKKAAKRREEEEEEEENWERRQ